MNKKELIENFISQIQEESISDVLDVLDALHEGLTEALTQGEYDRLQRIIDVKSGREMNVQMAAGREQVGMGHGAETREAQSKLKRTDKRKKLEQLLAKVAKRDPKAAEEVSASADSAETAMKSMLHAYKTMHGGAAPKSAWDKPRTF